VDHDGLSALQIEYKLVGLQVPQDDAHALALRAEREVPQDLIFLFVASRVLDLCRKLFSQ